MDNWRKKDSDLKTIQEIAFQKKHEKIKKLTERYDLLWSKRADLIRAERGKENDR